MTRFELDDREYISLEAVKHHTPNNTHIEFWVGDNHRVATAWVTPQQARDIAATLTRMADELEEQP